MEQSPSWEANNSHAVTQEISHLLLNLKVQYRVYKRPPLAPILSQMNPVHTFLSCLPKIHFIIILHLLLGLANKGKIVPVLN
jgi:hypothetical protein